MAEQLQGLATRLDSQHALLQWLHARCQSKPYRDFYRDAVGRYLASEGKDLLLAGVLIRDTQPSELDLKSPGSKLASRVDEPGRVELFAWYLPVSISHWPKSLQEAGL